MTQQELRCLNRPFFETPYMAGENPYFGRKDEDNIALFLDAFVKSAESIEAIPFLACGSLLGWMRHCKIMEHDGDIDLHLFLEDFDEAKFERELYKNLSRIGFAHGDHCLSPNGHNHYMIELDNITTRLGVAHIDLYLVVDQTDYPYLYFNKGHEFEASKYIWIPRKWLRNDPEFFVTRRIYDVPMQFPKSTPEICRHIYGDNCLDSIELSNHGMARAILDEDTTKEINMKFK
ncbi:MAG: hypothetical protein GY926_16840 [bacterium]|nr:hypothetical protein [bacterium]